jgi:hypothetical protein
MARQGRIPAFQLGSDWRFNREPIDRWRIAQEGVQRSERRDALGDEILDIVSC